MTFWSEFHCLYNYEYSIPLKGTYSNWTLGIDSKQIKVKRTKDVQYAWMYQLSNMQNYTLEPLVIIIAIFFIKVQGSTLLGKKKNQAFNGLKIKLYVRKLAKIKQMLSWDLLCHHLLV